MKHPKLKTLFLASFVLLASVTGLTLLHKDTISALDSDFSNGITVDSTLDTPDDSITNGPGADGICDDGDGNCTLRAAIEEANSDPDASTILFNISGTPDFTNNSQDGYTISPQSSLPDLTEQTTIDGYSQPGSQANTAIAPNPLNGTLLIEVDGSGAGTTEGFSTPGNGTIIKGLVINRFSGSGITINGDDIKVYGNYIGTDPTGLIDLGNDDGGILQGSDGSENLQVGSLNPADRNIVAGNENGGSSPNTGSNHWVYRGNYFSLGADGQTAISNNQVGGSGDLSLDNSDDHIVGGSEVGAINVIGASLGHGVAPHNSDNLVIEGNYIGFAYDGTTIMGNSSASGDGAGVTLSESDNALIKNNRVAGYAGGGIYVGSGSSNVVVSGNTVHDNLGPGINVLGAINVEVSDNVVYSNKIANMNLSGISAFGLVTDNLVVKGNKVGILGSGVAATNTTCGIFIFGDATNVLVGGIGNGDGNTISAGRGAGIAVMEYVSEGLGQSFYPVGVSILGNSVYDNQEVTSGLLTGPGLGIDLVIGTDTDSSPDGQPNSYTNLGPTLNDTGDPDTGPNNYINFPVLNSVSQTGAQATVNFSLDAADSPADQYRVEFFANDTADDSGYGEGQTFLGFTTVSNGNNQIANLTLPSGLNLSGKSISATTTAIDNTTDSGFGSTSEFSATVSASLTSGSSNSGAGTGSDLAGTGENSIGLITIGLAISLLAAISIVKHRRAIS